MSEDEFDTLIKLSPDSWNNIPIPLVEAFKILMNEIRTIKSRSHMTNFKIKQLNNKIIEKSAEAAEATINAVGDLSKMEERIKNNCKVQID